MSNLETTSTSTSETTTTTDPEECRAAFAEIATELCALPDTALVPVTLDVTTVVTIGLGAAPKLEVLGPELRKLADPAAGGLARRVRVTALALMHAHGAHQAFVQPQEPFTRRVARAQELRSKFATDIAAMIQRGVVDRKAMDDYRGTTGYKIMANDLTIAIQIVRNHWDQVSGRTFITEAELAEAERLVSQLLADIGGRDQGSPRANEAALTRQRAFTLFVTTYAEARRAVQYLRYHAGDADLIVPSLYAGRGNGNHRSAEEDGAATGVPQPDAAAPPAVVSAPVATPPAVTPVAAPPAAPATSAPAQAPVTSAAAVTGTVGGSPFTP